MTTKHLLYNKFIIQFAGKRIFTDKTVDSFTRLIRLALFFLKDAEVARQVE